MPTAPCSRAYTHADKPHLNPGSAPLNSSSLIPSWVVRVLPRHTLPLSLHSPATGCSHFAPSVFTSWVVWRPTAGVLQNQQLARLILMVHLSVSKTCVRRTCRSSQRSVCYTPASHPVKGARPYEQREPGLSIHTTYPTDAIRSHAYLAPLTAARIQRGRAGGALWCRRRSLRRAARGRAPATPSTTHG